MQQIIVCMECKTRPLHATMAAMTDKKFARQCSRCCKAQKKKKNIQFCFQYEFEKIAYNLSSQVGTWIVYLLPLSTSENNTSKED